MNDISLRRRLLKRLVIILFFTWVIIGSIVIWDAFHEAEEAYHGEAVHLAAMVANQVSLFKGDKENYSPDNDPVTAFGGDNFFVLARRAGQTIYKTSNAPPLDLLGSSTDGSLAFGGLDWFVMEKTLPNDHVQVFVGRAKTESHLFAIDVAAGATLPSLFGFCLILLASVYGIRSGLVPLERINSIIRKRSPRQTDPLPVDNLPIELKPMVESLNQLFERQTALQEREKRFVADASHELRTPLAAAKAQLQAIDQTNLDPNIALSLGKVTGAIDRMTRLTEQLLSLARSESIASEKTVVQADLHEIASDVMSEIYPLVIDTGVELELAGDAAVVLASKVHLGVLVRNLIDNAVRYAGTDARVLVTTGIEAGTSWVRVADSGPGMDEEMIAKAFHRFSRGRSTAGKKGSGLGLSIVKAIADRYHGNVVISRSTQLGGAEITVFFPQDAQT